MTETLVDRLKREEGYRAYVYDDANDKLINPGVKVVGNPTVGYGLALNRSPLTVAEATYLLLNRVAIAKDALLRVLPWTANLDEVRQGVLIDMSYQMGLTGLLEFSHMLDAVKAGSWSVAADDMKASEWARETPGRADALAALMLSGGDEQPLPIGPAT